MLQNESVTVTSPENTANGVKVQKEVTVALIIKSDTVTSHDIISNG
jgi:hypothetical protein